MRDPPSSAISLPSLMNTRRGTMKLAMTHPCATGGCDLLMSCGWSPCACTLIGALTLLVMHGMH